MKYLVAIMVTAVLLVSGCYDEMPMTSNTINKMEDCIQQQREQSVTGGSCHLVINDVNNTLNYIDSCVCVRRTEAQK